MFALDSVSRGTGVLAALAVKYGAPANLEAFVNAVQLAELELEKTDPNAATFLNGAYDGIETVLYDLNIPKPGSKAKS